MKNRKTKLNDYVRSVIGTTFLGVGLLGSGAQVAQADPLVLPDANCGVTATSNCLTFQDFNVYSLGLLMEYQDIGLITDPTLNFLAKPNDGLIFIDRFNGNGTSLQGPGTNIDNPYDSLTGNLNNTGSGFNQDNLRFLMASQSLNSGSDANDIPSDPTGTGSWDNTNANQSNVLNSDTFTNQFTDAKFSDPACQADINTQGCLPLWDVQVSDLLAVLGDSNLTFLFQMNETGDSGTLLGQDLTAWARVTLSGPGGEVSFTLGGNNPTIPQQQVAQTAGVDDILPTANDTWAHVHSEICVEENPGANFGAVFLGECTASGFVNGVTVNQSLGADQAGFAVISDALNLALRSGLYTVMTVDLREAWLNDGGEQLWIVGTCPPGDTECVSPPPPPVPEPATLALLGVGLAALALRRTKLRRA